MFHVLVLGGMALVGCGGATGTATDAGVGEPAPSDAAAADDSFPSETNASPPDASGEPPSTGTDAEPQPADSGHVGFPSELPPPPDPVDGGAGDAGEYADATRPDAGQCVPCELLK
jgi:hypothetical protein